MGVLHTLRRTLVSQVDTMPPEPWAFTATVNGGPPPEGGDDGEDQSVLAPSVQVGQPEQRGVERVCD